MTQPPDREWPEVVIWSLFIWQKLRGLGFYPEQIYAGVVVGDFLGRVTCVARVELRVGGLEFGVHLMPFFDADAFTRAWTELGDALADGAISDAQLDAWFGRYDKDFDDDAFRAAVRAAGIEIPSSLRGLVRGTS